MAGEIKVEGGEIIEREKMEDGEKRKGELEKCKNKINDNGRRGNRIKRKREDK